MNVSTNTLDLRGNDGQLYLTFAKNSSSIMTANVDCTSFIRLCLIRVKILRRHNKLLHFIEFVILNSRFWLDQIRASFSPLIRWCVASNHVELSKTIKAHICTAELVCLFLSRTDSGVQFFHVCPFWANAYIKNFLYNRLFYLTSFPLCCESVIWLQMPPYNGGVWYEVSWLAASAKSHACPNENLHTSLSESKHQITYLHSWLPITQCGHFFTKHSWLSQAHFTHPLLVIRLRLNQLSYSSAALHVLCLHRWRHCLISITTLKLILQFKCWE